MRNIINSGVIIITRYKEKELDNAITDLEKKGFVLLHKGKMKISEIKYKYLAKLKKVN